MNKWTNEQMNKWTNEQMNKWTNEQMNKWTNEQMNKWTNEQMNKWTNERIINESVCRTAPATPGLLIRTRPKQALEPLEEDATLKSEI